MPWLFLLWITAALVLCEVAFLKLFEERELELRFGSSYLAYKSTTPMFLGRRRRAQHAAMSGK